ncbi:MAG: hypothetical protein Q7R49_01690 [Candidatus Daviesbacteria bacterium]|nr:hypothetical protein [Candidatus Daviesbacteria bacterium]
MVLDTLNNDRTNIKDLNIDEPVDQRGLAFNPDTDITKSDRENLEKALMEKYNSEFDTSKYAVAIKTLFPEFTLDGTLRDNLEHWAKERIKDMRKNRNFLGVILNMRDYKEIGLEVAKNPDREIWNKNQHYLVNQAEPETHAVVAESLLILFPNRRNELYIDENLIVKRLAAVMSYKEKKQWETFAGGAANLRLLVPQSFARIGINEADWAGMRAQFDKLRQDPTKRLTFAYFARHLKILAAKEVKVTDKGLELTMPEPTQALTTSTPPMPETRKF